jgi:hypothetical protein
MAQQQQQVETVDLAAPRFNLDSYFGRLQHFQSTTSPLTLLASRATLLQAQGNVQKVEHQVKEAGGRGVWVTRAAREAYWNDRQCTWAVFCSLARSLKELRSAARAAVSSVRPGRACVPRPDDTSPRYSLQWSSRRSTPTRVCLSRSPSG